MRKLFIVGVVLSGYLATGHVLLTSAATPDGSAGPFADEVVSFSQGDRKDGSAVDAGNSDSGQALGEDDDLAVALGFGGNIVLKFDESKAVTSKIDIVEYSPGGDLAMVTVKVSMSRDGVNWTEAGTEDRGGKIDLPEELACAVYVKLEDISDSSVHEDGADGYNLDAVEAIDAGNCEALVAPPTPTPTDSPTPTPTTTPNDGNSGDDQDTDNDSTDDADETTEDVEDENTSSTESTNSSSSMSLLKSGPTCTERNFYVEVGLKHDDEGARDKTVLISYLGYTKTLVTGTDGKVSTIFEYGGEGEVRAESNGFNTQTIQVSELNCSTSQVLGATTEDDTPIGGRVLGATTERLAATGTYGYIQLYLLTAAATSGLVYLVLKFKAE